MGNWNINIQGIGPHHNTSNLTDADLMAAQFVADLKHAGHTVEVANFTSGAKTELLGIIPTAPVPENGLIPLVVAALLVLACGASAATTNAPPASTNAPPPAKTMQGGYDAGVWTVAGYGSLRLHEFSGPDGRGGGGAELGYFVVKNVALTFETLTEGSRHAGIDEVGFNVKGYLPIEGTRLAPYGLIGTTHAFDGVTKDQDNEWRFNLGAGVEFRANERFSLFADARWTHDFSIVGQGLIRLGGNLRF